MPTRKPDRLPIDVLSSLFPQTQYLSLVLSATIQQQQTPPLSPPTSPMDLIDHNLLNMFSSSVAASKDPIPASITYKYMNILVEYVRKKKKKTSKTHASQSLKLQRGKRNQVTKHRSNKDKPENKDVDL